MTPAGAAAGGGAFAGRRALVVGYGVSGRAAAHVLLTEGATVRVSEARDERAVSNEGAVHGQAPAQLPADVELRFGGHRPEHLDGTDLVVLSPGVPPGVPIITWARDRGIPVWSELELGARLCRVPCVGVTGTNGKTTTVEMVAAMMRAAGLAARACGNVGFPFSLASLDGSLQALAVEASSFQLAFHQSFHPRVSVLVNLAPDHLDWHGSFGAYAEAKERLFLRQGDRDVHIGNCDDRTAAAISARAPCTIRWFGRGEPAGPGDTGWPEGRVMAREPGTGRLLDVGRPASPGAAFASDAAAAAASGLAFGLPQEAIRETVERFAPLPHRGTVVAEAGSIRFVDDSKATNPHAALAALEGVRDAVLIAGGLAKGVDLAPLATAAKSLAGVVAIGEAAPEVARVFRGLVPVRIAGGMEEAVEAAFAMAPPDGTVILAPACASQDMFRDYRDRGDQFGAAARGRASREAARA